MKRRQIIVGALLLLIVGGITGFVINNRSDSPDNNTKNTVRYAAPLTIAAAPVYVADAMGMWKDEGIDMQVTYFDSGRKALDALLSNNAEVMSVSETPPLRAYLSGSKIETISTVTEHSEAKMTVRKDRISKPEDVKGKKIGTVVGTNSDYYMYRWLESNNIGVNEVTIVQLDATALSQAFVQGNVDVMFAWEPHNYNSSSKIPTLSESWPTELYEGRHTVNMNSAYLKDHSSNAEGIIRGFIKAEKYIISNPNEAKKIVMDRTGMSESALNDLWDDYVYKVQLDDELATILEGEASWIKTSGGSKSTVDISQMINPRHLSTVDASRVGGVFKR